jgi:DNA-directed RNA polymerase specialized sigma24 family protein
MERFTVGSGSLVVTVDNTAADIARAIHALSDDDLVRLKALARLWARGLPAGVGWTDVLHEAIVRALDGSRKSPPGVPILAFLSGIMRSICDDHWRRVRRESEMLVRNGELADVCASTEDAGDQLALIVIAGLAEGLTPAEICRRYGMSEREYDTTRRRMRRALLRRGLAGRAS